jgi:hypothetical protein
VALKIPKRWEDVTPAWMTHAIRARHPHAVAEKVELLSRDDGSNRRARFRIGYQQGKSGGPDLVFCKAHAPANRIVHLRNGNLFNEARLFKAAVPLDVDHPLVYTSVVDYLHLDFLLVMEDIVQRGADPRDATRPMTVAQVISGIRGLARVHSQYWNLSARTHPTLGWVKTWKASKGWQVGLSKRIPAGLVQGRNVLPPEVAGHTADRMLDLWVRYVASLSRGPMTLLHGDAHIGNTYVLPDGEVGFLDWQVVRRGEWSQDVGYFLISALETAERRRGEADILEEYRRCLRVPEDQRPTTTQIWNRYRATPAYGLPIWLSTLGAGSYQSREICLRLCERFAAAFTELDTVHAL